MDNSDWISAASRLRTMRDDVASRDPTAVLADADHLAATLAVGDSVVARRRSELSPGTQYAIRPLEYQAFRNDGSLEHGVMRGFLREEGFIRTLLNPLDSRRYRRAVYRSNEAGREGYEIESIRTPVQAEGVREELAGLAPKIAALQATAAERTAAAQAVDTAAARASRDICAPLAPGEHIAWPSQELPRWPGIGGYTAELQCQEVGYDATAGDHVERGVVKTLVVQFHHRVFGEGPKVVVGGLDSASSRLPFRYFEPGNGNLLAPADNTAQATVTRLQPEISRQFAAARAATEFVLD